MLTIDLDQRGQPFGRVLFLRQLILKSETGIDRNVAEQRLCEPSLDAAEGANDVGRPLGSLQQIGFLFP